MEELTNIRRSEDFDQSKSFYSTSSAEKSTIKTYDLLRKQENILSQFENNLQKTLSLLNNHSPSVIRTDEDMRNLISQNSPFGSQQRESTRSPEFRFNILERENYSLKSEIGELEKENSFLKQHVSAVRSSHRPTPSVEGNAHYLMEIEELRQKNKIITNENEELRAELSRVKNDYFKKYENLQRNNDDLLLSYEERYKLSIKNLSQKYEQEIENLKEELYHLELLNKKSEDMFFKQKDKLETSNKQLEKERAELLSKLNNSEIHQENITFNNSMINRDSVASSTSAVMLEQLMKEKHDLEFRYHELFSSYSDLLEHNRNLAKRLESFESEPRVNTRLSRKSLKTENKTSPKRIESSMGRIVKNKDKRHNFSILSEDERLIRDNLRESALYGPITLESDMKPRNYIEDDVRDKKVSHFEETENDDETSQILKPKESKTPNKKSTTENDVKENKKPTSTKKKVKKKASHTTLKQELKEVENNTPLSILNKKALKTNPSKDSIKANTFYKAENSSQNVFKKFENTMPAGFKEKSNK